MPTDTTAVDRSIRTPGLIPGEKPQLFELRMSVLYMAVFIPSSLITPYLPLWLGESGFLASEIGALLAIPMFARVIAGPTISALADRASDRAPVLIGLAILATCAAVGYLFTPGYALVMLVSIIYAVFWGPLTPLCDSLALSGVRRFNSDYAKMRIWGSVAYFIMNVVGGWAIGRAGADAFPWMLIAGSACIVVTAWLLAPRIGAPLRPALQPVEALPRAAPVFGSLYFILFLSASALFQASHAV
ncbi:MAG: MFS transporter, partial [Rhizobiaceae bacterium]